MDLSIIISYSDTLYLREDSKGYREAFIIVIMNNQSYWEEVTFKVIVIHNSINITIIKAN